MITSINKNIMKMIGMITKKYLRRRMKMKMKDRTMRVNRNIKEKRTIFRALTKIH